MKKHFDFLRVLLIGWLVIIAAFSLGSGFVTWSTEAMRISEWGAVWRLLCLAAMLAWLKTGVEKEYL